VEPEGFIVRASVGIASTGSEQALIEIGKLMRLDESRFGRFIESTLNGMPWNYRETIKRV